MSANYNNPITIEVYNSGPPGKDALQGLKGDPGDAGADGKDGSYWLSGVINPYPDLGKDDDFFLNTMTGEVFQKQLGSWNFQLNIKATPDIVEGADGTSIYTSDETPPESFGNIGDLHLNSSNGDLSKKNENNIWTVEGNLAGPPGSSGTGDPGADGAGWIVNSGIPSSGIGKVNDLYLNTSNGDFYTKTSSTVWTLSGSLKGAKGDVGTGIAQFTSGSASFNITNPTGPNLNVDLLVSDSANTAQGSSSSLVMTARANVFLIQKGANIASASTLTIPNSGVNNVGGYHEVTGTNVINGLSCSGTFIGREVELEFQNILTLTHNSTSFILRGNASITTKPGDVGRFRCINPSLQYWKMLSYSPNVAPY